MKSLHIQLDACGTFWSLASHYTTLLFATYLKRPRALLTRQATRQILSRELMYQLPVAISQHLLLIIHNSRRLK